MTPRFTLMSILISSPHVILPCKLLDIITFICYIALNERKKSTWKNRMENFSQAWAFLRLIFFHLSQSIWWWIEVWSIYEQQEGMDFPFTEISLYPSHSTSMIVLCSLFHCQFPFSGQKHIKYNFQNTQREKKPIFVHENSKCHQ